tara:strand:- start:270 stop:404 length:135 start_codon:yes stop_codon:yes gene_type:complete
MIDFFFNWNIIQMILIIFAFIIGIYLLYQKLEKEKKENFEDRDN